MTASPKKRFFTYMLLVIAAALLIAALLNVYATMRDHDRQQAETPRVQL